MRAQRGASAYFGAASPGIGWGFRGWSLGEEDIREGAQRGPMRLVVHTRICAQFLGRVHQRWHISGNKS